MVRAMIRLEGVTRSFGDDDAGRVLRGIDLEVDDGALVAVLGRSGSGKTTLLNIVGGLDTGYTGHVEVAGRKLAGLGDAALSDYRNREVGFVFQSFHLLDHLTCAENVALPAAFARGKQAPDDAQALVRARELLDRVGLADKADAPPARLSGGEKQRVAVARALFSRPQLIICDEPTGNLDATTGADVIELFVRLNHDDEITFVIATHDEAIARAASRVVHIVDGKIRDGDGGNGKEATE